MIRRLIVPLGYAALVLQASAALAQAPFPAPLPESGVSGSTPPASLGGAVPSSPGGPPEACMMELIPLRREAERQHSLIGAARDRKAPFDETCKLIGNYAAAEIKLIRYFDANAAKCGFASQTGEQLKANHETTARIWREICRSAQTASQTGPGLDDDPGSSGRKRPLVGDFWTRQQMDYLGGQSR